MEAADRNLETTLAAVEAAHAAAMQTALRNAKMEADAERVAAVQQARAEVREAAAQQIKLARGEAVAAQASALRKARVDGVSELVAELEAAAEKVEETQRRRRSSLGLQSVSTPTTRHFSSVGGASFDGNGTDSSPWEAPPLSISWKSCFFKG